MEEQTPQEEKNKGGRPLKFTTVSELKLRINEYFDRCDPHTEMRRVIDGHGKEGNALWVDREVLTPGVPYTITGLARALKTSRETLLDYESGKYDDKADDIDAAGDKFSDTIKDAKLRVQQNAEEFLMSGAPATGAIFWLKNNAGWKDRQEVDHTTKDQPIPLLAGIAPATLVVEDDDGGTAPADDSADKDQQS
ncbi:terminase small subunit [Rhodococcus qingshengii]|uniref:terminase small subunit n=1 Tax=Rhodococcus qingshengii TaxID=334542 RepID=UPI003015B6C4